MIHRPESLLALLIFAGAWLIFLGVLGAFADWKDKQDHCRFWRK